MSSPAKPKVGGKSSMSWNDTAQADLLKCILARHAPTKVDYQGLEKDMRALGYDCTAKAITHRIQKIKSTPTTTTSGNEADPATPTGTPSKLPTTAKKSRASPVKKPTANANGKGKAAATKGKANKRKRDESKEDEEQAEGSDVSEPGEKKMKVKEEDEEEEDEGEGAAEV